VEFSIPSLFVAEYKMGDNIIFCMEDGKLAGFLSGIIKAQLQEVYRLPLQHTVSAAFILPYETPALGLREEPDGGRGAFSLVAEGDGEKFHKMKLNNLTIQLSHSAIKLFLLAYVTQDDYFPRFTYMNVW
jgi:hypothetical protein